MAQLLRINDIFENINVLGNIFDIVRRVDPFHKSASISEACNTCSSVECNTSCKGCFKLWKKNGVCDNCISMRAYREKKTFFKLEYICSKVFIVVAIPVKAEGIDTAVVELIKDVTDDIIINELKMENQSSLLEIIDNLNQLQIKDSLTGIYNRRYIDEYLPVDIAENIASHSTLSIIMFDFDHFKQVNDSYGHVAGDHMLKNISELISELMKDYYGWFARYGGEEFLISMPGSDTASAASLAEKIRESIERHTIEYAGNIMQITASFGVATLSDGKDATVESFIESADKNLYAAKSAGRNKVVAG